MINKLFGGIRVSATSGTCELDVKGQQESDRHKWLTCEEEAACARTNIADLC